MKQWSILLVFLSLSLSLSAQQGYEKDVFVSSTGDSLPYRMIRPESMKAGKKYPLVLFLHGAGERGPMLGTPAGQGAPRQCYQ